jgi:LPXTG-motif cell wall-anchored protein
MKKALLIAGAMFGFLVTTGLMNASNSVFAASRDCSTNSIAKCGALSVGELQQKYNQNQPGDLDNIYAHYGISAADMGNASLIKEGMTYKDGRVVVDGKTVATNSASLGRNKKSHDYAVTIDGKTYWEAKSQDVYRGNSIEAYVFLNADGTFKAAVLKDCGNPVKATPTPKPEQPKPEQPKPEQPKPKPTPAYTCESLTAIKIDRTNYRFDAEASASNGANVTKYRYDFGDGTTEETTEATVTHEYTEADDYTATVTALVDVNGKSETSTNDDCAVEVTVEEAPVEECKPGVPVGDDRCEEKKETPCEVKGKEDLPADSDDCKEDETPAVIPATGIGSVFGGLMGASSLSAAGYYYVRSRRLL